MDLQTQEAIKRLADNDGADGLVVVLGAPDPESAAIAAETVVTGDPSWAGPLAGVQLDLDVRHILEDDVRVLIPEDVWEEQVGLMADVLDGAALAAAVKAIRDGHGG